MFIYKPDGTLESQSLKDRVKEKFGMMPPHWELLVQMNPKRFEMFMDEIGYLLNHPHIHPDFFAFIRLYIASKEGFSYCKSFNTKLLLARGYDKKVLQAYKYDIYTLPLDEKHQALMVGVMKAMFEPDDFSAQDIKSLKVYGWSDGDIYDAIDHGAFLFKFSRILKAYLS